uniref:FERM and PDZ domain containing 2 n=1 Tax=Gasterosteus aculeatus aculeatus TaxID=481459 RepID=G3NQF4_GASAC
MGTFVTLAEVLEGRGSKLDEDEVWCLLLATTEALLSLYCASFSGSGNMCSVLSPGSVLLSGNGSLAFKSCARYEDVASFTAPEIQQGQAASTRTSMVVYSLGMTLYWCVDYHLPQNQPVQMSAELEGLLLSMCEDMVVRRTDLLTVLETCELHHRASMLPPADRLIRQLVEDVYRNSVKHSPVHLILTGHQGRYNTPYNRGFVAHRPLSLTHLQFTTQKDTLDRPPVENEKRYVMFKPLCPK